MNCFDFYNVFDENLIVELIVVCIVFDVDKDVCVVILVGCGKSFLVGVDFNWMKCVVNNGFDDNLNDVCGLVIMLWILVEMKKLIIVCVQGVVLGGGIGLIVVCDIVVVLIKVFFVIFEVKFGIIFLVISFYVVCVIGVCQVYCYFQLVECIDVVCVCEFGFVYEMVELEQFDVKVQEIVDVLIFGGLFVQVVVKELICVVDYQLINYILVEDIVYCIVYLCVMLEVREGIVVFFDKWLFVWSGE